MISIIYYEQKQYIQYSMQHRRGKKWCTPSSIQNLKKHILHESQKPAVL